MLVCFKSDCMLTDIFLPSVQNFYLRHYLVIIKHWSGVSCVVCVVSIILWLLHDAVLFFSASVQWLLLKTSTPAVMQCMVRWLLVLLL